MEQKTTVNSQKKTNKTKILTARQLVCSKRVYALGKN